MGAHGVHHALAPERAAVTPREWVHKLWGSFRGSRSDRDLEDELRVHLERFRFSCSKAVAAMPDVVRALVWHEEPEGCSHQRSDVVERALTRGA